MNTVHLADCASVLWRNGGGRTRELLAWPAANDWLVRVSVAEIACDGPFSAYAGIDRWFAVLDGAGVVLTLPQGEVMLQAGSAPVAFAGEAAPGCRLIAGPTLDLNLMLRRGLPARSWRGVFTDHTLYWTDDPGEALPQPAARQGWCLSTRAMERAE